MIRKRPEYDEGVVRRVARKLYEIFYGSKAYIKPKKKITTTRTIDTETQLKEAGITKKRIRKLRD